MDAVSFRIDHAFNSRLSMFGRYNHSPSGTLFRFESLSSIKDQQVNTDTFTAGLNWLISGNISDSLRFNYSKQTAFGSNHVDNFGGATPPSPAALLPAGVSVNDSFAVFSPAFVGFFQGVNDNMKSLFIGLDAKNQVAQWNVINDFTLAKGSHQFKLGIDYRRLPIQQEGINSPFNYLHLDAARFASQAMVIFIGNNIRRPASFSFDSFSA